MREGREADQPTLLTLRLNPKILNENKNVTGQKKRHNEVEKWLK